MASRTLTLEKLFWILLISVLGYEVKAAAIQMTYDKACHGKPAGKYALPDVFKYLNCKYGMATISACQKDTYYIPLLRYCANPKRHNAKTNFCNYRPDGLYRNPWDCTSFVQCHGGRTFEGKCGKNLRLSPETMKCEWERNVPCVVVS